MLFFYSFLKQKYSMENSHEEPSTYTSQLETIKAIENNLTQLKSRITFLQKQDNRSSERIERLFQSSIPIIHRKIKQSQHLKKVKNFYASTAQSKFDRAEEIKISRIAQEMQINKNKQQVNRSKIFGSFHIREMSKKNQKLIETAKKEWVEEKRKKNELVKACRMESRRKIQQFHQEKQNYLRQMKRQQGVHLEQQIDERSVALAEMIRAEAQESKRYKSNQKMLQRLQHIVSFIQTMKPEVFLQIFNELKLTKNTELNDQVIEAIFVSVNQRIKQKQPGNNKINIFPAKNVLNRYKSEESQLENIYGSEYSVKKIR